MTLSDDELRARETMATEVIRQAGEMALDYFKKRAELVIEKKGVQDLVSKADREVETFIRGELQAGFPDDGFVGEEYGAAGDDRQCWVIDPIDGTQNFLRGLPYWTVVIAFVVDDVVELGLTFDPIHNELFTARRGRGAFRDGVEIACRDTEGPTDACVALSFGFKDDWQEYVDVQGKFLAQGTDMRRLGSTALILCHVADGRLDVLYAPGNQSWDCLAGLVLVSEAGGAVCDFLGANGLLGRGPVVASSAGAAKMATAATGVEVLRLV